MKDKINIMDIIEGRASTKDVKFDWQMWMMNHYGNGKPLVVCFDAINIEYPDYNKGEAEAILASSKWKEIKAKLKEIHPSIKDLGKMELKQRGYDRFVLFGHSDEVGNLTRAKKYFRDHQVKDVDANKLFEEAVASGRIPVEEVERLKK